MDKPITDAESAELDSSSLDSINAERAEIKRRVANFRRHQVEMIAKRDARMDHVTEDIRERVAQLKQ